ncbi:hypothetical protein FACS1894196_3440 [Clostridia bacterium]|nr:hypothetical protein FACS1894196_3440 [Clostridia bacterium]
MKNRLLKVTSVLLTILLVVSSFAVAPAYAAGDGRPTKPTISVSKKTLKPGEDATFKFSAVDATSYALNVYRGTEKVLTQDVGAATTFTTSFIPLGKYTATLTATNAKGSVDSKKIPFTVDMKKPSKLTLAVDKAKSKLVAGENITFNFGAVDAASYAISIAQGKKVVVSQNLGMATTFTTTLPSEGTYSVTLTATNAKGSTTKKITIKLLSGKPTKPVISVDKKTFKPGEAATFKFSAVDATGYTLRVLRGKESVLTQDVGAATSFSSAFTPLGSYSAYITATNVKGGTDSKKITFKVDMKKPSKATIAVEQADKKYVTGEAVTFSFGAVDGASYVLNVSLGKKKVLTQDVGAATTYVYPFATAGKYTATIIAKNAKGSVNSKAVAFTVFAPTANPTNPAIKADKAQYASGEQVTFTFGATDAATYKVVVEREGVQVLAKDTGTAKTLAQSFVEGGNYTAYVTATNSAGSVNSGKVTFVVSAPVATAAPTAVPTTVPTAAPTAAPTAVPTAAPTAVPTIAPTTAPTAEPEKYEPGISWLQIEAYDGGISENVFRPGGFGIDWYAFYVTSYIVALKHEGTEIWTLEKTEGIVEGGDYGYEEDMELSNTGNYILSITATNGMDSAYEEVAFSLATELTSGDYQYMVKSDGSVALTKYSGSATALTIPEQLDGKLVTSIGNRAFESRIRLTSVTIPSGITSIGERAFSSCYSLTSITIPSSVTSIGDEAFTYCDSLTSITVSAGNTNFASIDGVLIDTTTQTLFQYPIGKPATSYTIPSGVTSIGEWAFFGCYGLTSITIPSGVTSIGDDAFIDCTNLASITISDSVTSIGSAAFAWCEKLTSITIPSGITSIGPQVFESCTSLTSVTIPDSVRWIERRAFYGCTSLTSITIPSSVTWIWWEAFALCEKLTEIIIPDGVETIEFNTFIGCTSLTSVSIPASVTEIEYDAFYGCTALTTLTIPASVTQIGADVFSGCTSLTLAVASGSAALRYAIDNNIPYTIQ